MCLLNNSDLVVNMLEKHDRLGRLGEVGDEASWVRTLYELEQRQRRMRDDKLLISHLLLTNHDYFLGSWVFLAFLLLGGVVKSDESVQIVGVTSQINDDIVVVNLCQAFIEHAKFLEKC